MYNKKVTKERTSKNSVKENLPIVFGSWFVNFSQKRVGFDWIGWNMFLCGSWCQMTTILSMMTFDSATPFSNTTSSINITNIIIFTNTSWIITTWICIISFTSWWTEKIKLILTMKRRTYINYHSLFHNVVLVHK